jgi:hypothetical protein
LRGVSVTRVAVAEVDHLDRAALAEALLGRELPERGADPLVAVTARLSRPHSAQRRLPVHLDDVVRLEKHARAGSLGQRLDASTLFVMKLRDRRIRPETMTDGFRRRVAEELDVPVELLAAHFVARPTLPHGASYKSDEAPQVGEQQTFEEAVKSSGLTAEEQAYLLAL